jgi:glycosyltransferase involved in cell wall biosynthesis
LKPKSILHVVPALFDQKRGIFGGAERYAFELARNMAEVRPTTLLTFGKENHERNVGALRVKVMGPAYHVKKQTTNPVALAMIPEVLHADVVHCHQQHVVASSLTAAICRATGKKVVVSDLGGGGWDISSYVSTDRWYHAHLHISKYSRTVFGHDQKAWAQVIYGGVDTTMFSPDACVVKENTALFVGRLMPHKGVDSLVRALPPGMRLELIGQPYDQRFLGDLHRLAQGKEVVFRHDCSDQDIVNAYRRAMCIVLPSVYKDQYGGRTEVPELLGQTLLEGMACGTPAICTDVASMPEVVEDGETGFVVPPNHPESLKDKLLWLQTHRKRAAEMGAAGRQRALDLFTWNRVVERCLEAYRC